MTRRLFLIETNLKSLVEEIKATGAEIYGVYNIIETFIENEHSHTLTQLLSVFEMANEDTEPVYARAEFSAKTAAWRLEQLGDREVISSETYYEELLSSPTRAVDPKARMVFTLHGVRYSLESNMERNYSVIQIDYYGDSNAHYEELFKNFGSIEILGELYMSLEETFARLHLDQKPSGSLQDAVSILNLSDNRSNKKAGI